MGKRRRARRERPNLKMLNPPVNLRETIIPLADIAADAKKNPSPPPSTLPEEERQAIRDGRAGKKTVVIFGWAERTRGLLDWDALTPEIEVWGLNECYNDPSGFFREARATAWFQIHPRWDFTRKNNHNDPHHFDWLKKKHDFHIWMTKEFPDIPDSRQYPLDDICEAYGPNKRRARYFKSTAATMVALAIYLGFDRIEIYGVEMIGGDDYVKQRGNLEFWLGAAMGKGIDIYTPSISSLSWWTDNPLYGFEAMPRLNVTHLELRRNMYADSAKKLDFEMVQLQGEMRILLKQMSKPEIGAGRKQRLKEQIDQMEQRLVDIAQKTAWTKGNKNAFEWIIKETKTAGEVQLKLDEGVDPNDLDWGTPKEEPLESKQEAETESAVPS